MLYESCQKMVRHRCRNKARCRKRRQRELRRRRRSRRQKEKPRQLHHRNRKEVTSRATRKRTTTPIRRRARPSIGGAQHDRQRRRDPRARESRNYPKFNDMRRKLWERSMRRRIGKSVITGIKWKTESMIQHRTRDSNSREHDLLVRVGGVQCGPRVH